MSKIDQIITSELYKNIKDFFNNELSFFAASLSFYTIFALIPLLLIVLSIATSLPSFELYLDRIRDFILSNLMPTHTEAISGYLDSFMDNSLKSGTVGIIYVLLTSLMFFKNYEYLIAIIFETKRRDFWSALSVYWTLITLLPIGLLLSLFLSSEIQGVLDSNEYTNWVDFISIVPFLIIWLIFFIVYKISANMGISSKSALIASFLSSLIWSVSKFLFVYYVLYNKAYASIYGSFSMILFFFLWIYFSWIIILYGLSLTKILNDKEIDSQ